MAELMQAKLWQLASKEKQSLCCDRCVPIWTVNADMFYRVNAGLPWYQNRGAWILDVWHQLQSLICLVTTSACNVLCINTLSANKCTFFFIEHYVTPAGE
jgi:hypothetical protein